MGSTAGTIAADEPPFQLGGSIPALLAEEWLVQPWTILPTFFEVFLVQQAQTTVSTTLESSLRLLRDKVRGLLIRLLQIKDKNEHGDPSPTTSRITTLTRSSLKRRLYKGLLAKGSETLQALDTVLTKYSREILLILRYFMERQSLRMNSSMLSESVYGLKRSTVERTTGQLRSQMDRSTQRRLALVSALIPYVVSHVRDCVPRNQMQRKLLSIVKGCLTVQYLVDAAFSYSYMIGSTHYTSWINYWLGHVVRRISQAEMVLSSSSETTTTAADKTTTGDPSPALASIRNRAYGVLLSATALSYTMQCISWYRKTFPTIPEPPKRLLEKPGCPICLNPSPVDPTVVPTTGLVYCGRCITRHVRIHRVCPVTKLPLQHLQRLYEPE
jgi:Pex2 / Pex12 amino terminal region